MKRFKVEASKVVEQVYVFDIEAEDVEDAMDQAEELLGTWPGEPVEEVEVETQITLAREIGE